MKDPQYIKLYNNLKNRIITGIFKEGELLPSENELTTSKAVARSTVRQALDKLVQDGYIKKKQGVGSIVSSPVKRLGLLSFKGFSDVVGKTNQNQRTEILNGPEAKPWPENFFYNLSYEEKNLGCIYVERLRFVDKNPVMLEYTYLPNDDLSSLCSKPFVHQSLFRTLHIKHQIEINNVIQDLRAIKSKGEVSELLDIPVNDPVLHIHRQYFTSRPGYKIYSSLYCNTKHYAIGSNY